MNRFKKIVRKLIADEDGAALVEYGLLVALIAAVALTAIGLLGTNISDLFTKVAGNIK